MQLCISNLAQFAFCTSCNALQLAFQLKLTASVRRWHFQLHTAHTAQFRGACNALQDKAFADGGLDPISDDSDDDKPLGRRMTKPIA